MDPHSFSPRPEFTLYRPAENLRVADISCWIGDRNYWHSGDILALGDYDFSTSYSSISVAIIVVDMSKDMKKWKE